MADPFQGCGLPPCCNSRDFRAALDGARAELLAVVTHELRTPLAVVRAYVDLLADASLDVAALPGPAQVEDWRGQAIAQVTRLDRLVDSILASVRGEGLAQALKRTPFDVTRAVNDTIAEMGPLLREHPLLRQGTWEQLMGIGDEGRFRQVLEHLLENEVKYAPAAGSVAVSATAGSHEIRVSITDDGPVRFRGLRSDGQSAARLGDRPVCRPPAHDRDGRPGLARIERRRRQSLHGRRAARSRSEGPRGTRGGSDVRGRLAPKPHNHPYKAAAESKADERDGIAPRVEPAHPRGG